MKEYSSIIRMTKCVIMVNCKIQNTDNEKSIKTKWEYKKYVNTSIQDSKNTSKTCESI